MPTFLSLFSGIGGLDLGLERAGWRCVGQVEIDPYRRGILERWWPDVPKTEDVCDVGVRPLRANGHAAGGISTGAEGTWTSGSADLICGGFPCQDLSVAGKRAGLEGSRSSLFFEFARIADALHPRWLLVENVPGLLSSNGGRDFVVVLATLADLGYGVAWRVLDSRYFGVPQRRRRVFVVGHLGVEGPEPFLPFLEGGEGNPAESGEAGEESAAVSLSGIGSGGPDDNDGQAGRIVTAHALTSGGRETGPHGALDGNNLVVHALTSEGHDASEDGTGRGTPLVAAPLSHGSNPNSNAAGRRREDDENLVYPLARRGREGGSVLEVGEEGTYNALRAGDGGSSRLPQALVGQSVRRLTPVECCRLQGFPDDWLGGNEPPDSPKYAALGDAVTVPVAEWIGRRLLAAPRDKLVNPLPRDPDGLGDLGVGDTIVVGGGSGGGSRDLGEGHAVEGPGLLAPPVLPGHLDQFQPQGLVHVPSFCQPKLDRSRAGCQVAFDATRTGVR